MSDSTKKSVSEFEKKRNHEGAGEEDHKHDRERTATEKERSAVKDITEAPRQ